MEHTKQRLLRCVIRGNNHSVGRIGLVLILGSIFLFIQNYGMSLEVSRVDPIAIEFKPFNFILVVATAIAVCFGVCAGVVSTVVRGKQKRIDRPRRMCQWPQGHRNFCGEIVGGFFGLLFLAVCIGLIGALFFDQSSDLIRHSFRILGILFISIGVGALLVTYCFSLVRSEDKSSTDGM